MKSRIRSCGRTLAAALAACGVLGSALPLATPASGATRQRLVFAADFRPAALGRQWGWQSGSFADCRTNPGDHKLDVLTRSALRFDGGSLTITASPRGDGSWNTGLITTGDSCSTGGSGFQLRTGDLVTAHLKFPAATSGAWPAVWSWRAGDHEIDLMEWHSAAPHRLEFVNHARGTYTYWSSSAVHPGASLWLGVRLGATRVTWYAGATQKTMKAVWHDARGVGSAFRAYPAISLSVSDGEIYPRPASSRPISFTVYDYHVLR
ncbi:LamG domain-containing protein [Streptacidiphilus rugosus]|uniref:hypothetical protein n=1 Tax=Streptacidiphilus rugosus TaxID=405783 RepID=UPI00068AD5F3|nr:hypothetical protein [Streptacidiphilus rugosus]